MTNQQSEGMERPYGNHKLFGNLDGRWEKWKWKIGLWGPNSGFQNISLKQNWSFEYEYSYSKVEFNKYYKKQQKDTKKILHFFLPKS